MTDFNSKAGLSSHLPFQFPAMKAAFDVTNPTMEAVSAIVGFPAPEPGREQPAPERIDHAAEARKHIDWAHEQQGEEGRFDETVQHNATLAVAEATLALAEQQRIANLIAAISKWGGEPGSWPHVIREGLGLL